MDKIILDANGHVAEIHTHTDRLEDAIDKLGPFDDDFALSSAE